MQNQSGQKCLIKLKLWSDENADSAIFKTFESDISVTNH